MPGSSAVKQRAEVRIATSTYDDLPGIATSELLAFSGAFPPYDVLARLIHTFRAPLARSGAHPKHWPDYPSVVRERGQNLRDGSIMFTAFVKDKEGKEIVAGMARMTPPREVKERLRQSRKWKDRVLGDVVFPVVENVRNKLLGDSDGTDKRLLVVLKKELEAARDRADKDRRYFLLNILHVHPSFQGIGAGSALLAHCCSIADAEGVPLLLESTDAGITLYKSRGFVQVDAVDFTYAGEHIVLPCMVRQPVPPVPPPKNGSFVIETNNSTPDLDKLDELINKGDTRKETGE